VSGDGKDGKRSRRDPAAPNAMTLCLSHGAETTTRPWGRRETVTEGESVPTSSVPFLLPAQKQRRVVRIDSGDPLCGSRGAARADIVSAVDSHGGVA
jgi:hypothetical protein